MRVEKLAIRADAISVLSEIRRALRALVSQFPGDVARPTDLQRTLGLDYKLCWQILTITRTEETLSISQHVPGPSSTRRLLAASRSLKVPERVLSEVDRAINRFQSVVAAHSDDRRGFDSMIASISGGDAAEMLSLQNRRDAFRGERQIWGTQLRAYLCQQIVRKSDKGPGYDKCFVNAKYGLRCLRQNIWPIVHGYRDVSAGEHKSEQVEPLDPEAAHKYGAPVLTDFSTKPVPRFKTIQNEDGWVYSALDTDQIGRKSTVDLVFGGVGRNRPLESDENGSAALVCAANVIAPTELCICEIVVHRPSFKTITPSVAIYATGAGSDVPNVMRMTQQFLIGEDVSELGSAKSVLPLPEIPSYSTQLRYALKKLGWKSSEFDIFRVTIPYPILHTRCRISCQVHD